MAFKMRGNPFKQTDPPSTKKETIFRGKITTSSDGTKYYYDKDGNVKKMVTPDGTTTKYPKGSRKYK
tara:strand:- start:681 stop:881 length:201 start_codon:yes stop_codon:yes gene_type:complete